MTITIAEKDKDPKTYPDGYIIAGDGFYEKTTNGWISHMTKVDTIPDLPEMKDSTFLVLKMPKIPFGIILDAWDFFRAVSTKYKGEAIVLLTYDEKTYGLVAPKQEVSGASLSYKTEDCKNVVGTIHSHNTMSAFHSGTDDKDEEKMDGIHLTLGNVMESFPSISCSATKNGERFMFRVDSLFKMDDVTRTLNMEESIKQVDEKKHAYEWDKEKDKGRYAGWGNQHGRNCVTDPGFDHYDKGDYEEGVGGDFSDWSKKYKEEFK